jgi:hypothetical protein
VCSGSPVPAQPICSTLRTERQTLRWRCIRFGHVEEGARG